MADASQNISNPALVNLDIVGSLFQNLRNRFDVNDDGVVSPIDVLVVINSIRRGGTRVIADGEPNPPYVDVDGDLSVAPIDVLQVINFLRLVRANPEGESALAARLGSDDVSNPSSNGAIMDIDSIEYRRKSKLADTVFAEYQDGI